VLETIHTMELGDQIKITYYTDPLCCWSWALEPQWRKLLHEYEGQLEVTYKMGGLLKDWNSFQDPMNVVSKPIQMGPVWLEAKYISGVPIQDSIWIHDAPSSSYPACIAVKSAGLQSRPAEEALLQALWEGVMVKGLNIARPETIMGIAKDVTTRAPQTFSFEAFQQDFNSPASREAFREDLESTRRYKISRFPTLILKNGQGKALQITGYRTYAVLEQALMALSVPSNAFNPVSC